MFDSRSQTCEQSWMGAYKLGVGLGMLLGPPLELVITQDNTNHHQHVNYCQQILLR